MTDTSPTIELFVRSLGPTGGEGHVERILDRLADLDSRGIVEDYDVTVWGTDIVRDAAERTETGRHVLDSIESFEEWAADNGASVARFYETRTVERGLTGESYRVTSLPVVAMAEYEDGDLGHVTPHETEVGVETVLDRLDVLGERDVERSEERKATPIA